MCFDAQDDRLYRTVSAGLRNLTGLAVDSAKVASENLLSRIKIRKVLRTWTKTLPVWWRKLFLRQNR